jgi:hypothetical protein
MLAPGHDEIRSICDRNGSAPPLPLGEGWGEGLRYLVVHRPLTRFAEFIIGRRFAPTRWQIDLCPPGRGEAGNYRGRRGIRSLGWPTEAALPVPKPCMFLVKYPPAWFDIRIK